MLRHYIRALCAPLNPRLSFFARIILDSANYRSIKCKKIRFINLTIFVKPVILSKTLFTIQHFIFIPFTSKNQLGQYHPNHLFQNNVDLAFYISNLSLKNRSFWCNNSEVSALQGQINRMSEPIVAMLISGKFRLLWAINPQGLHLQ